MAGTQTRTPHVCAPRRGGGGKPAPPGGPMGQIAVDKKDAEAKREVALQDEAEAQGKANECNEIKASAQVSPPPRHSLG